MAVEELKSKNEWEEHLEKLRNMPPEEKEAYLARKFEEGQRQGKRNFGETCRADYDSR